MVKRGDILTVAKEVFGESGLILFTPNQKVKVRDVWISEGHYSKSFPSIWFPEKLKGVMLEGHTGIWFPEMFKELLINT